MSTETSAPRLRPHFTPEPHRWIRPFGAPLPYCNRSTLLTKLPGLERIDLQLLKMIDDARERFAARGINLDSKVFLWGFSASGQFVSRFVMLHPDRVKAASFGSPMYGPTVPRQREAAKPCPITPAFRTWDN